MLAVLCLIVAQTGNAPEVDRHIYQIGSYSALSSGKYDGTEPISDLVAHGNFGVGTFNGLDGEMVMLDGQMYHADSLGNVDCPRFSLKTPFACEVTFQPDIAITLDHACTAAEMQSIIEAQVTDPEQILAIRIDGSFLDLQTRAYPPQVKPYQPLAQLKDQTLFNYPRMEGTFVGFRMPKDIGPSNVPGYHFHFIDKPELRAGHVLSYSIETGTIRIMKVDRRIRQIESLPTVGSI